MTINIFYANQTFREIALALLEVIPDSTVIERLDTKSRDLHILLCIQEIASFPTNYIAYQFEQLSGSQWMTDTYLTKLRNAVEVWDYSLVNVQILMRQYGFGTMREKTQNVVAYVPLGWVKSLEASSALVQPIDVLFYGSMNERRKKILDSLRANHPDWRIEIRTSVWGAERDHLIDRAKVVLNLHYYEQPILETSRIAHLLNRGACVVSEKSTDLIADRAYEKLVVFVSENNFAQAKCSNGTDNNFAQAKCSNGTDNNLDKTVTDLLTDKQYTIYQQSTLFREKMPYKASIPYDHLTYLLSHMPRFIQAELLEDGARLSLEHFAHLVPISIVTPTKNRKDLFQTAIRNFYAFKYPRELIEWVIIDSSDDASLIDLLPTDPHIKYRHLTEPVPLWQKRNMSVELASHDIIIHMDDDDYYFPESLYAKVSLLQKYGAGCVGSSEIGVYHLLDNYSYLIKSRMMPEAGLAYRRSFWQAQPFVDRDLAHGEGSAFLEGRTDQVVDFPYWFNLIAITHHDNATGALRTLTDRPKATHNFFNLWDLDTQLFFIKMRRTINKKSPFYESV